MLSLQQALAEWFFSTVPQSKGRPPRTSCWYHSLDNVCTLARKNILRQTEAPFSGYRELEHHLMYSAAAAPRYVPTHLHLVHDGH